jgi:orotate phosphoribosyltransferase
MKEVEALINKAFKYKESGLTEHEIADELNVSKQTAVWLLSRGKEQKPSEDIKVGLRSIGVFPTRISFISDAMCDIILEECKDANTIVGIAVNGIPYATFIADKLGLEMAIFRPHFQKSGVFSSNYATVKGKNVVIIDDVVGSGMTFRSAIKAIKDEKGKPLLCMAVLNKRTQNTIDDVPLRSLIRARVI